MLNRIDYKLVFKSLDKDALTKIMKGKIKELLGARKENKDVKLPIFSDQKIRKIIDEIYEPQFGARPLERYIENAIEPTLIKQLMKKNK
ncbi:hypothetical protein KKG31_02415 [Patescibacteria group bacterium]|nr:hypothetical protein [Patescibacteria group bacterium]